ncbi:MAG: TonB-dependent receptor, partial [Pseudomonadota bacterium]|nr:TonB-dependent receptor [Pseudomonadota bacterium]
LNGYTLFDIRLNKRIEATHINLYVGADNLFDKNYETSYGFPQAGRVIYTGIEYGL